MGKIKIYEMVTRYDQMNISYDSSNTIYGICETFK